MCCQTWCSSWSNIRQFLKTLFCNLPSVISLKDIEWFLKRMPVNFCLHMDQKIRIKSEQNGPSLNQIWTKSEQYGPSLDQIWTKRERNGPSLDQIWTKSDRNGPAVLYFVYSSDTCHSTLVYKQWNSACYLFLICRLWWGKKHAALRNIVEIMRRNLGFSIKNNEIIASRDWW